MTELLPNIFAIQVPVDSFGFEINKKNQLGFWENVLQGSLWQVVDLPGNYYFICASLNCSEMDAAQITVSKKQLLNLLSKRGLNPELNYAILRKQF